DDVAGPKAEAIGVAAWRRTEDMQAVARALRTGRIDQRTEARDPPRRFIEAHGHPIGMLPECARRAQVRQRRLHVLAHALLGLWRRAARRSSGVRRVGAGSAARQTQCEQPDHRLGAWTVALVSDWHRQIRLISTWRWRTLISAPSSSLRRFHSSSS